MCGYSTGGTTLKTPLTEGFFVFLIDEILFITLVIMKKLIILLALFLTSYSYSQNLYKELSNQMTFEQAKNELNENFSYKYTNIKLGDFPHLFEVGDWASRNLYEKPLEEFQGLELFGGLYYVKNSRLDKLVGVQMFSRSNFSLVYEETQLLVEFFEGRDFVVESNLGGYIRKELSDRDYYGSMLVHLKKNSLNLIINYKNTDNNEMLFQLVLFDDDDKKEFKYIIGAPEIVDDGF